MHTKSNTHAYIEGKIVEMLIPQYVDRVMNHSDDPVQTIKTIDHQLMYDHVRDVLSDDLTTIFDKILELNTEDKLPMLALYGSSFAISEVLDKNIYDVFDNLDYELIAESVKISVTYQVIRELSERLEIAEL